MKSYNSITYQFRKLKFECKKKPFQNFNYKKCIRQSNKDMGIKPKRLKKAIN